MSRIELRRVCVTLERNRVLDDVTLFAPGGAWVCLIGPNGSGKTTLLKAIAGLVAHSGEIRVGDVSPARIPRRELARRVALVPQNPVLPPEMAVIDYVLMGRTPHIPYFGAESRRDLEIAAEVLEGLDLAQLGRRRLDSLSGGELQRALLARALAQQAPVLLLDEPTASLDVGHAQRMLELVDDLRARRGLTILSAMHDLTLAGQFADELVLMSAGRVVAAGPARVVLTEGAIGEHYDASVRVLEDIEGAIVVIPARSGNRSVVR
ncbi:MAG: ABC transporter ATP-binding protein [Actinomycetota bacterium]